jgi:hypothetical protein
MRCNWRFAGIPTLVAARVLLACLAPVKTGIARIKSAGESGRYAK